MAQPDPNQDPQDRRSDPQRARRGVTILAVCALFWLLVAWIALKLI